MDDDFVKEFEEGFTEEEPKAVEPEVKEAEPVEEDKPEPETKEEEPEASEEKSEPEAKEPVEEEKPETSVKEDLKSILNDIRNEETTSKKEIDSTYNEVIETYYPDGLSNVLVDKSGEEIKTIEDVIRLSGDTLTAEEAGRWLLNEQQQLNQRIEQEKTKARDIAETNISFVKSSNRVLDRYKDVFTKHPDVQARVYEQFMKTVQMDKQHNIIISAPVDIEEFYSIALAGYENAPTAVQPTPAPKQTASDRLDVSGDGGEGEVDDPNDFEQQIRKEFSK